MLSFHDYVAVQEGFSAADRTSGHEITGGLSLNKDVAGDVGQITRALAKALGRYKGRTISFLRSLGDDEIHGILDKMNATDLNRVRTVMKRGLDRSEPDMLAPNMADSATGDLP